VIDWGTGCHDLLKGERGELLPDWLLNRGLLVLGLSSLFTRQFDELNARPLVRTPFAALVGAVFVSLLQWEGIEDGVHTPRLLLVGLFGVGHVDCKC
jgi:hypothetical protein